MTADAWVAIRQAEPSLRKGERLVARFVLDNPEAVLEMAIGQLADSTGTSQSTILRFCKNLGYSGYREFRLAMARSVDREESQRDRFSIEHGEINESDTAEQVVAKVAYNEARTIEQTAQFLDLAAVERVVSAMAEADRIELYGIGSSALACQDMQQKLHRIGLLAFAWSDAHLALTSAALLTPRSVAIAVSYTGLTIETNHALEVAASTGATTVAITNYPDSPLAELADEALLTMARETKFRSGAMSSRIAQLAVIDILFIRLVQRVYDQASQSLKRTYDAVQHHRIPPGRPPKSSR
ncbi:MAG: MurR/RpiR family transcriptional regulator [Bifidobacteriaceae bacterium]|jgi:DNA-binding MurR/RpiR family transcriptional regulator|nr:MurR/RpiR family transcriptional regulator [Bifidobacteriaceae bacterium]